MCIRDRLNEAQYRVVKKMAKAECANNDNGNCLLLDDGETCVCPQCISYSLLCRYFSEAVLPANREFCAEVMKDRSIDSVSYTHLENRNTGEVSSISQREPEENYTKPAADAAEQVIDRIGTCLLYTSRCV